METTPVSMGEVGISDAQEGVGGKDEKKQHLHVTGYRDSWSSLELSQAQCETVR
jgi:hypothetical protein